MVMQNSEGGGGGRGEGGTGNKVHYGLCESINKLNEVWSFVMEK